MNEIVGVKENNLYFTENGGKYKVEYSEQALNLLQHKGIDCQRLLTLNHKLSTPLYSYQYEAVHKAKQNMWSLLIADGMGLGKTLEAIACIVASNSQKTLIVVPANIKWQWCRNLNKHIINCPFIKVCCGMDYELADIVSLQTAKIIVINYDIISAWLEPLLKFKYDLMILDESQKIKKRVAFRTKAVLKLRPKSKACICLSGTPLTDRNADIYNTIHLVNPKLFTSRFAFESRYCMKSLDKYNHISTSVNTIELHNKLIESNTMIRRTKKDVYNEIPKVNISVVPVKVGSTKLSTLEDKTEHLRKTCHSMNGLYKGQAELRYRASIEEYMQEAVKLKIPVVLDWVKDFLENSDEKLIIACVHKDKCGKILQEKLGDIAVLVNGDLTAKRKDTVLNKFITDDSVKVLIGNIQSISAGIDGLQSVCSTMAVCELPYSPSDLHQLYARLDRRGQTEKVNIYIHCIYDSLDERMAQLIDKKDKIVSEVLDGKYVGGEKALTNLINKSKGNKK